MVWFEPDSKARSALEHDLAPPVLSAPVEGPWPEASTRDLRTSEAEARVTSPLPSEPTRIAKAEAEPASGTAFWCQLLSSSGGYPIADALVQDHDLMLHSRRAPPRILDPARTDRFGLVELRLGRFVKGSVRAEARGFSPVIFPVSFDHQSPETALEIRMVASASLRVRVTRVDSSPVVGAQIELRVHGSRPSGTGLAWVKSTDSRGTCTFNDLPTGETIAARATLAGTLILNQPDGLNLSQGERQEVEWVIGMGVPISGRLIDQTGKPVASREIWLLRSPSNASLERERIYLVPADRHDVIASTTSDSAGFFQFEDVATGRWYVGPCPHRSRVRLHERKSALAPVAAAIEVSEGSLPLPLILTASRGLFLTGKVVNPNGEPPRRVQWLARSELGTLGTYAGYGASLLLGPIEPIEHQLLCLGSGSTLDSSWVSAYPGDEVVLQLVGGAGSLTGRFVDSRTGEASSAKVIVFHEESRMTTSSPAPSAEFSFGGLQPGTYHLTAINPNGLAGTLAGVIVDPGRAQAPLVIALEPAASLRLINRADSKQSTYALEMNGRPLSSGSLLPGVPTVEVVPPGSVKVKVRDGERVVAERVVVCRAGEEVAVEF